MILEGITANFLGDSITAGYGTTDREKCVFHQIIKRECNLKEARNYGISGTRIAKQKTPSTPKTHDLDFVLRAKDMDNDADLVVVFGGTNDFGHGDAPLGKFSDTTQDTFYGALHVLYTLLIEKYPASKIVVMTPLHRTGEDSTRGGGIGNDYRKPEGSHPLIDYVNAIREVAQYYSLPVIDLYSISTLQPNVAVIKQRYVPDGLHPNDDGHKVLANVIKNALLSL